MDTHDPAETSPLIINKQDYNQYAYSSSPSAELRSPPPYALPQKDTFDNRTEPFDNRTEPVFPPPPAEEKNDSKSRALLISFILMIFFGLGNKVMSKVQTKPMYNYAFFQSIYTSFVYIPVSFAYIWPMILFGSAISKEERQTPQWKFAVMGGLDGVAAVLQSFANNYISQGSLLILLQQAAIPISMVISIALLKARYKPQHYLGAVFVMLGLVVAVIPTFLPKPKPHEHELEKTNLAQLEYVWIIIMLVSCVPMTLSSVFKEKALGDVNMDPMYMNGYVAIYQSIISIPLGIPLQILIDGTAKNLPSEFWNGVRCYVGLNSQQTDVCGLAPVYTNLYLAFNIGYNILIILILKYGGATLLWICMTIVVPLGFLIFFVPFVPYSTPWKFPDNLCAILGLIIILSGLVVYRFGFFFRRYLNSGKSAGIPEEELPREEQLPHRISVFIPRVDQLEASELLVSELMIDVQRERPEALLRRQPHQIRHSYFSRLGIPQRPPADYQ